MKDRRKAQLKRKLYPLYLMLKALFEDGIEEPKALAHAAGKPDWWARRMLRRFM